MSDIMKKLKNTERKKEKEHIEYLKVKLAEAQPKVKELSEKYNIPRSEWTLLEDLYCMTDEELPGVRDLQYHLVEKYGLTREQIKKWAAGEKYD